MPEVDLSEKVPPKATWVKVKYKMKPKKPGADLIARLWSGILDDAVVIKGAEGEADIRLDKPQKLSYQRPVTIDLALKVIAYKIEDPS